MTELSSCAGCAAKLQPAALSALLAGLPRVTDASVLVGFESSDDAAVYRLDAKTAIVSTVDFFPPVVDDPFAYGQIAAANAMSDIWAMGAEALFALNVVAFPKDQPRSVLKAILAGGASKAAEARIPIVGGHSIQSPEPKYGMAVTGRVHPRRALTNRGGRAGDLIVLTKPLGTGIATTAIKRGVASKALTKRVTEQMATLNKAAGEVFANARHHVHALTDVTGFGLLGHGLELARGAGLRLVLELERVPVLPEVAALAEAEVIPGGTRSNLEHAAKGTRFPKGLPLSIRHVLADAQTNGGLLAALPEARVAGVLAALERRGVEGYVIGQLVTGKPGIEVQ